ncbi:MAG: hypothetical protein KGJ72_10360, partial [Gammaproteobacteria bacterium]|nr:hypothetical protein [Gammaproteobacteria bacterium]
GAAGRPQPPRQSSPPQDMDARRRQAVQDWLEYRASLEQPGRGPESQGSPPASMDEIRRRAVAAWRSLQARGAESQSSAASGRNRDTAEERGEAGQARDTRGRGEDFSR